MCKNSRLYDAQCGCIRVAPVMFFSSGTKGREHTYVLLSFTSVVLRIQVDVTALPDGVAKLFDRFCRANVPPKTDRS